MGAAEMVHRILSTLTPDRLRQIIEDISRTQAVDNREGVPIGSIIDVLVAGKDLGSGSEWWEALLALQRGIREIVSGMQGMRYIEVDS